MKRIYALYAALVLAMAACNQPTEKTEGNSTTTTTSPVQDNNSLPTVIKDKCYMFVAAKDTYALRLKFDGNKVTGKAIYKNYQKDSSHGDVTGEKDGDLIKLWYNMFAEGMQSKSQLVLKADGENLQQGIGDIVSHGDSAYFKDLNKLTYGPIVYKPAECQTTPLR